MSVDKPLFVRVHEALGNECFFGAVEKNNERPWWPNSGQVPRYDQSWEATGPLIERYGIHLAQFKDGTWNAAYFTPEAGMFSSEDGKGPLEAVCHLILALSAAGKLK